MRVAIVHEHLAQDGGAELVVRVLKEIFPDAPIFTLVYDRERAHPAFKEMEIRPSFIQRMWGGIKHYQWYLPFMPSAVEKYDVSDFDVVISSSSAYAKGIVTHSNTLHLCYCYCPTRYLWNYTHQYHRELRYSKVIRKFIPFVLTPLRMWDKLAADRVDHFIGISGFIGQQINKFYRRKCSIIYPPVEVEKFRHTKKSGNYYLMLGRLVAYKRYDLAINVFNKLGWQLKIAGDGPEFDFLKKIAGPNIELLGRVSDKERTKLFEECHAFIFPPEEDFGIVPIEAMAAGRPVVAFGKGGALEYVKPGVTGELFSEQTEESLMNTLKTFRPENYDPDTIRRHAEFFRKDRFKSEIKELVERKWREHKTKIESVKSVDNSY